LLLPPSLVHFQHLTPLLCVSFQFLFIVHFWVLILFLFARGSVCPVGYAGFILGEAGRIPCDAWCPLVGLAKVSQAGLEPASGGIAALLFSQYNVVWRSFPQARGSGCQCFDPHCCFISTKCGSRVSVRFWSHRSSHCLLLHPSHHLGSLF
jgi:hypothetical protein